MISKDEGAGSKYYRNITAQGTGIVIGDGSSVVVGGHSLPPRQAELLEKLDNFMKLVARHEGALEDPSDVRESLVEAQREAAVPSPRWTVVRALLGRIADSVKRVAVLTEAINGIIEIVGHIPK
jgi:hypothetical protein